MSIFEKMSMEDDLDEVTILCFKSPAGFPLPLESSLSTSSSQQPSPPGPSPPPIIYISSSDDDDDEVQSSSPPPRKKRRAVKKSPEESLREAHVLLDRCSESPTVKPKRKAKLLAKRKNSLIIGKEMDSMGLAGTMMVDSSDSDSDAETNYRNGRINIGRMLYKKKERPVENEQPLRRSSRQPINFPQFQLQPSPKKTNSKAIKKPKCKAKHQQPNKIVNDRQRKNGALHWTEENCVDISQWPNQCLLCVRKRDQKVKVDPAKNGQSHVLANHMDRVLMSCRLCIKAWPYFNRVEAGRHLTKAHYLQDVDVFINDRSARHDPRLADLWVSSFKDAPMPPESLEEVEVSQKTKKNKKEQLVSSKQLNVEFVRDCLSVSWVENPPKRRGKTGSWVPKEEVEKKEEDTGMLEEEDLKKPFFPDGSAHLSLSNKSSVPSLFLKKEKQEPVEGEEIAPSASVFLSQCEVLEAKATVSWLIQEVEQRVQTEQRNREAFFVILETMKNVGGWAFDMARCSELENDVICRFLNCYFEYFAV